MLSRISFPLPKIKYIFILDIGEYANYFLFLNY